MVKRTTMAKETTTTKPTTKQTTKPKSTTTSIVNAVRNTDGEDDVG